MAYTANIPQANHRLVNSQPQILNNFIAIDDLIRVNHFTFNTGADGKHQFVTLPAQLVVPPTAAGEIVLFSETSLLTGNVELLMRRENNGASIEMTSAFPANTGWTFLPSGILLKWGGIPGVAGVNAVVYPGGPNTPPFTQVFQTYLTVVNDVATADNNRAVTLSAINYTIAGFEVFCSERTTIGVPAATAFLYLTIGI